MFELCDRCSRLVFLSENIHAMELESDLLEIDGDFESASWVAAELVDAQLELGLVVKEPCMCITAKLDEPI